MHNQRAPIFQNWNAYESTLPVRETGKNTTLELPTLGYWATEQSLDQAYEKIKYIVDGDRKLVKYISAESGAGKSTSIIPIFLRGRNRDDDFTHYVYLPFSNNGKKNFGVDNCSRSDLKRSETQGAAFMLEVLKRFFRDFDDNNNADAPIPLYKSNIELCPSSDSVEATHGRINNLLNRNLPDDRRVLFHIDEHRKIAHHPDFRRGAIQALAQYGDCAVVATYVDPPIEVNPRKSSLRLS